MNNRTLFDKRNRFCYPHIFGNNAKQRIQSTDKYVKIETPSTPFASNT